MTQIADMNPRYLAYARAQGLSVDELVVRDGNLYPGGRMSGFILWLRKQWEDWAQTQPQKVRQDLRNGVTSAEQHAAFDAWLGIKPGVPTK